MNIMKKNYKSFIIIGFLLYFFIKNVNVNSKSKYYTQKKKKYVYEN